MLGIRYFMPIVNMSSLVGFVMGSYIFMRAVCLKPCVCMVWHGLEAEWPMYVCRYVCWPKPYLPYDLHCMPIFKMPGQYGNEVIYHYMLILEFWLTSWMNVAYFYFFLFFFILFYFIFYFILFYFILFYFYFIFINDCYLYAVS